MNHTKWLTHFRDNRELRFRIPWEAGVHPEPALRRPLIRSLQRFQVGESGAGKHLSKLAGTLNSPEYSEAIALFVVEEQRHAALMAEALRQLNAPLLRFHWSDAAFVLLRRVSGLREELLVLLVPEMIAQRYFRALHDGTRDPALRAMFAQMGHDEEGHVAFHQSTLAWLFRESGLACRSLTRIAWRLLFRAACAVLILDHWSALRAARVSPLDFWWDCGLIFDEVAAKVFRTDSQPSADAALAASELAIQFRPSSAIPNLRSP
jgi:demethoxyubiquinone hydroxylase (CLK1/Coq7/Cat5 family)